jgi:eukaryotic-like serine/threonine-protein kinase
MSSGLGSPTHFRFGVFEASTETGELQKKGVRVKLQEQPFQLLSLLLENAGEIVSRESVRERLWPGNTFVEFDASLSVAVGKLRDALGDSADNPRFVETIPRKGYRFIAPVECVAPPPSGAAKSNSISTRDQAAQAPGLPSAKSWRPNIGYLALALVALGWTGAYVFQSLHKHPAAAAAESIVVPAPPHIRRSVAVLGFRNLPGRKDDEWLSQAFSEMLGTELSAGGALRVVSDEDVARSKREIPLGDEETLAKSTLAHLRTKAGADVVVVGSYTPISGKDRERIRLDVRLQDTATGETIAEDAVTGSREDLFEIATRAGEHLRKSLGLNELTADNANAVRASLPANQDAVRYYSEGRAKLWVFDFVGARDLLTKAVKADPTYPLAHSALSDAWWHLGYLSNAIEEAKRAIDLRGALPEEERLRIEASYWGTTGDWQKTADAYRALFAIHPDSLEYGLRLAGAQYHIKPADSLQTLATLRRLPPPSGDDPRIDLLEASAQVSQNLAAGRAAAKRAVEKGSAQGSPLMVARAYGILCQVGPSIGTSTEETIRDCENAKQSYAAAGDHNNEARTINDLAGVYFQRGDLAQAESMWRVAEKEFRQNGDTSGLAVTSNNIGDVLVLSGRLPEAKRLLEQALASYRALNDKEGESLVLNDLGDIARRQGNLKLAETNYQQAKVPASEIGNKNAVAYVLAGLGDVLTDRGNLSAARESYGEAMALRTQLGQKQAIAETQVSLAMLSIEEGHPSEAEASLRKWKEQFHQEQQADDELFASTVLVQALLSQGKLPDVAAELERATPLAKSSQNIFVRLQFELASARAAVMSDHPESARTALQQILKTARSHGFVGTELEARLGVSQMELKAGNVSFARTQLAALEKEAGAAGFGLVAKKAAAARP